jgi:hypothetical protein
MVEPPLQHVEQLVDETRGVQVQVRFFSKLDSDLESH